MKDEVTFVYGACLAVVQKPGQETGRNREEQYACVSNVYDKCDGGMR